ncbi:MAG: crossover junction endodeoxyribonuclease RuvC [Bacteroidia bacterium]
MRIILGIDPGTQVTGYGLIRIEEKRMSLVGCGVIKMGRQQSSHPEKLKRIFNRIHSIIEEFKPTEMALEAPFHGKNVQAMLKLGRAQGVAMAAGLFHDLPIFEYAPRKVKMAVTGNGNASKEMVAGMLEKVLNFKQGKYLDATDGLAVAVCHFYQDNAIGGGKSYGSWNDFVKDNPDKLR